MAALALGTRRLVRGKAGECKCKCKLGEGWWTQTQTRRGVHVSRRPVRGRAGGREPGLVNASECKTMTAAVMMTAGVAAAMAMAVTRYKGSEGGPKKHRCVYTSTRDSTNKHKQVQGEHRGTNECGGYNEHWGANKCMNAAWSVVGAMHPLSPIPFSPYPLPFFYFFYYLNIFTYFYVHIILYLEYFNDK